MNIKEEPLKTHQEDDQQQGDVKPNAYRTNDEDADESSLKRNYIIGGEMKDANAAGMEGEGMGGQQFGNENHPPTGDDPANPSRNAGYTNAYFARTEPLQEDTENNNFKNKAQEGEPDYQSAETHVPEENNNGQEQQNAGEQLNTSEPGKADYKEENERGPDYGSNSPEIPGPNEKPEQQKVGGA